MRKVRLIKTNQGVKFRAQDDPTAPVYVRGEFKLKEQGFEVWRETNPNSKKIMKKDKYVFIK